MIKYFIQFQHLCKRCKRNVDIVSRSDQEGLVYSCHFNTTAASKDALEFCDNSFGEFVR